VSDVLSVATLNATVLAIYEAVLIVFVANAGTARRALNTRMRQVVRELDNFGHQQPGRVIDNRRWDQYATDTNARRLDLELRLDQLLDPERVRNLVEEDEYEVDRLAKLQEVLWEHGRIVKDKVAELGTPGAVVEFLEAERKMEHDRAVDWVDSAIKPKSGQGGGHRGWGYRADPRPAPPSRTGKKRRSDYPVPEGDADGGVVLAEILAALLSQPPLASGVRKKGDYIATEEHPTAPRLNTPDEAQLWVESVESSISHAYSSLIDHVEVADRLLNAAAAEQSHLRDSDQPPVAVKDRERQVLVDMARSHAAHRDRIARIATLVFDRVLYLSEELASDLELWRRSRPSATHKIGLEVGLIVGAVLLVVGVVAPLLDATAPRWLYVGVPACSYALVALLLGTLAVRNVSHL
jgi:hypothetical protein